MQRDSVLEGACSHDETAQVISAACLDRSSSSMASCCRQPFQKTLLLAAIERHHCHLSIGAHADLGMLGFPAPEGHADRMQTNQIRPLKHPNV